MRPASIGDSQLVDALGDVVSRHGIDGASLVRLSEASGLKRASLYHRFPDGKDGIVDAVVARTADRFQNVLAPAFTDADPAERARDVATAIDEYYGAGERSCLIVALSVADADRRLAAGGCVDAWSDAFQAISKDAGMSSKMAADVAMDAVAAIEGALVISATRGDVGPFKRALASLPDRLVPAD